MRIREVEGLHVTRLAFRPDLELTLEDVDSPTRWENRVLVTLSGTLTVRRPRGEPVTLVATPLGRDHYALLDGLPSYRFIYESQVERCEVIEGGVIRLSFPDGSIETPPAPGGDAWEVLDAEGGVDGLRVICMPGGEVAMWDRKH